MCMGHIHRKKDTHTHSKCRSWPACQSVRLENIGDKAKKGEMKPKYLSQKSRQVLDQKFSTHKKTPRPKHKNVIIKYAIVYNLTSLMTAHVKGK